MGMYDEIRCLTPLPIEGDWKERWFQTKSLSCELKRYEIRADGTLWKEEFDTEDRSDPSKEGLERLVGMLTPVNHRWEQRTTFTGEIVFHGFHDNTDKRFDECSKRGWIEFSTYFVRGQLKHVELLKMEVAK